tara:strand:- start:330 stop:602 length:273 start_codon:yes stop_codon:yes gene_type:complete
MKKNNTRFNNNFINSLLGTYIEMSALECIADESYNCDTAGIQYIDIDTIEKTKQEIATAIVEMIVDYQTHLNNFSDEIIEFNYFKNENIE